MTPVNPFDKLLLNAAITTILPVFFLLSLGVGLRFFHWLSEGTVSQLNKVLYWFFVPALLFYKTSTLEWDFAGTFRLFCALLAGSLATLVISWGLSSSMTLNKKSITAFMQASFRGNLAFIGLPIVLMVVAHERTSSQDLEGQIYLLLAPGIIFYNLAAVLLIQYGVQVENRNVRGLLLKELSKNPLILSILCGVGFGSMGFTVSEVVQTILALMSQAVLPMALIGVGASLSLNRGLLLEPVGWVAGVMKVGVNPFCGYLAAKAIGLSDEETRMLVILMAAPTATSAFILSGQLGSDVRLTAKVILTSVLLSLVVYPLILSLTNPL